MPRHSITHPQALSLRHFLVFSAHCQPKSHAGRFSGFSNCVVFSGMSAQSDKALSTCFQEWRLWGYAPAQRFRRSYNALRSTRCRPPFSIRKGVGEPIGIAAIGKVRQHPIVFLESPPRSRCSLVLAESSLECVAGEAGERAISENTLRQCSSFARCQHRFPRHRIVTSCLSWGGLRLSRSALPCPAPPSGRAVCGMPLR